MPRDFSSAHQNISTPLGRIHLAATEKGIAQLSFSRNQSVNAVRKTVASTRQRKWFAQIKMALGRYAKGDLRAFGKIPVDIEGTLFQKKVWSLLKQIPAGKTLSYAEVARRARRSKAFRAVGTACGANPVALIIPCHRVVGSNGSLGGYAGGLSVKSRLLSHESQACQVKSK